MHLAMGASLPLPKYHQVYLVLREQLQEGRYADGLPGELALAGQFGVARVTVRKALAQLADEGLIERAPGRGTMPRVPAPTLAHTPARHAGARLTGLLENIVNVGLRTSVKVLACSTVPADAEVAAALQLPPGTPVQQARRVRATPQGPLSLITTHVPATLARGFGARELARKPLLVLLEEAGVHIGSAVQTISAQLADAATARHLDVPAGSALLAVTRLVRDGDERPVQWLHGLYRPDRYQYRMQLSRIGGIDAKLWVSTELSAQFH